MPEYWWVDAFHKRYGDAFVTLFWNFEKIEFDYYSAGAFGIANPALSGTAYVSVSTLVSTFGWDTITQLKANGAKRGQGLAQVLLDLRRATLNAEWVPFANHDIHQETPRLYANCLVQPQANRLCLVA